MAEISHTAMGLAMALMTAPFGDLVPAPLGVLVFGVLAAWFATILWHDGLMSRAGVTYRGRGGASSSLSAGGVGVSTGVRVGQRRDDHAGYNLHHLIGCVAMIVMFATGHGSGAVSTTGAETALGHHQLAPLTSLSWLFGLYFLVAATSLGFRVGEPAVRTTYRMAVPAGPGLPPAPAPRPAPSRLLWSSAGRCASEVALSGGMALIFFASL
ncbi:DUF5134 domain-containing protein [Jiangella asiatica]|uniref:DUF5134 domain-containing protein n=1 Tax=Jiangella asiatica TaxID=2530372 RepID=A0A4R5CN52_9ACTN|nr:DUF5134 domain-containing protein [Jiangella asiatica]TDE00767.1 DUF5134 domain-containing protein [Jiangella asiatica]